MIEREDIQDSIRNHFQAEALARCRAMVPSGWVLVPMALAERAAKAKSINAGEVSERVAICAALAAYARPEGELEPVPE